MALLTIVQFPDPRLFIKAKKVENIDDKIRRIVDDMYETMYDARGVGLAATQVGIDLQIFTMDVTHEGNQRICAINPEILSKEGDDYEDEGCLSVGGGVYDKIHRPSKVHMRALDIEGKPFELHAEDLMAHCIQHEVDHLQGKLFIHYLSRLKQDRIRKRIEKVNRE